MKTTTTSDTMIIQAPASMWDGVLDSLQTMETIPVKFGDQTRTIPGRIIAKDRRLDRLIHDLHPRNRGEGSHDQEIDLDLLRIINRLLTNEIETLEGILEDETVRSRKRIERRIYTLRLWMALTSVP